MQNTISHFHLALCSNMNANGALKSIHLFYTHCTFLKWCIHNKYIFTCKYDMQVKQHYWLRLLSLIYIPNAMQYAWIEWRGSGLTSFLHASHPVLLLHSNHPNCTHHQMMQITFVHSVHISSYRILCGCFEVWHKFVVCFIAQQAHSTLVKNRRQPQNNLKNVWIFLMCSSFRAFPLSQKTNWSLRYSGAPISFSHQCAGFESKAVPRVRTS